MIKHWCLSPCHMMHYLVVLLNFVGACYLLTIDCDQPLFYGFFVILLAEDKKLLGVNVKQPLSNPSLLCKCYKLVLICLYQT